MSGSAKKRREKARNRARRAKRHERVGSDWCHFLGNVIKSIDPGVSQREPSPATGYIESSDGRRFPTEITPTSKQP